MKKKRRRDLLYINQGMRGGPNALLNIAEIEFWKLGLVKKIANKEVGYFVSGF